MGARLRPWDLSVLLGAWWLLLAVGCSERVGSLTVVPEESTLGTVGQTIRLQAEPLTRHGASAKGVSLRFTSRDPSVATVDSSGLVTAVDHGATTVVVQAEGTEVMAFARVVVRIPQQVEVRPSSTSCFIGGRKKLTARVLDRDGEAIPGVAITWASSDEKMLSVDKQGNMVGLDEGVATVTASSVGLKGSSQVTVAWPPEQKAALQAAKRRRGRRSGGSGSNDGNQTKKGWDPRLGMFD
jgi:uncharacterized protein YjdB